MIYCLFGENNFLRQQKLSEIVGRERLERYDGEELTRGDLPDIFLGQTLFTTERTVCIKGSSANKMIWDELADWCEKIDSSFKLILIDIKPDKRTKTYKWLQKNAKIELCSYWTLRDTPRATRWLNEYAALSGVVISNLLIDTMIQRATRLSSIDEKPVIDQDLLANTVEQLVGMDGDVTIDILDAVMSPSALENAFDLLSVALHGSVEKVNSMIGHLKMYEDPHRLIALIASQTLTLSSLVLGKDSRSVDQIASDTKSHPYALNQMHSLAKGMQLEQIKNIVGALAEADLQMKRGLGNPWSSLQTALLVIANRK